MGVTLRDVAERAGVSRSAVSRCYTPGASISATTRAKVEAAAAALGYSPNKLASSLTTGRTKLVGVVSNNFQNPFFLEIFDAVTRDLQARDLRPLLVNLTAEMEPANAVRMLTQYSVDAVIVVSSELPVSFAEQFHQAGLLVVHAFGRVSETPRIPVLGIDDQEAGRLAARTLIERGYRSIGFLGGPEGATSTQDRYRGFVDEVARHTGVAFSSTFAEAYSFNAGRATMDRLMRGALHEAYFCGDDVLSVGALTALQAGGLDVPGDVGLLGVNDMELAGWPNIALTSIRNPVREIVAATVELVADILESGATDPVSIRFDCDIVERATLRNRAVT